MASVVPSISGYPHLDILGFNEIARHVFQGCGVLRASTTGFRDYLDLDIPVRTALRARMRPTTRIGALETCAMRKNKDRI